ncbi:MAG: DegV family protein [Anaerolineales bacterium]|nr:DegV family protein [Anaerolineales bacterium]
MSKLKIVIDSAGDLPADWLSEYDIHMIPINIHFGEQTFLQGVNLSNAEFYRLADESGVIPKTSQPTPGQFIEIYHKVADKGDTILSIHLTSKLSGTFASAEIAARDLKDVYRVIPFDSGCGSAGMGYMVREARLMERAGAKIDAILARLEEIRRGMQIILTIKSFEYARRSGRVKALQAALASMLNVKPVIMLREGVLEVGDRVRTRGKALEYLVEEMKRRMGDRLVNVAVVHAEDLEAANLLIEKVRRVLNIRQLITTDLSIGIAANLGPGTVGVVAYPVEEIG